MQGLPLEDATYPDDDVTYALSAPGIDIMCDQRFLLDKPSELPAHVLDAAAGRMVALCAVHSVDDSFACAVWANGELVRSLSLSLPGERAMRFLFGFALEGRPEPEDVDAGRIGMLGYRITDPTGAEKAAREAALREFVQAHRRRTYRVGPGGSLVEIEGNVT